MCNAHTCIYPYIYGNHSAFFSALGALSQHWKQLALFYRFHARPFVGVFQKLSTNRFVNF